MNPNFLAKLVRTYLVESRDGLLSLAVQTRVQKEREELRVRNAFLQIPVL